MCSEPDFGASVSGSRDDDRRRLAVKAQAWGRKRSGCGNGRNLGQRLAEPESRPTSDGEGHP